MPFELWSQSTQREDLTFDTTQARWRARWKRHLGGWVKTGGSRDVAYSLFNWVLAMACGQVSLV